ncbi:MAG: acyl-CoA thioesterase [Pseudomonadales bacterium]
MYTLQQRVGFAHCDPAGIVFYPRYFEMINTSVERWFSDALGYSFAQMHVRDKVGVPTVSIETQFHAPSYLEDLLTFELSLRALGHKSADVVIDVHCANAKRVSVVLTLVFVELSAARPHSQPWPEQLRQKMLAFVRT